MSAQPVDLSDVRQRRAAAKKIAREALKSDADDPMEAFNPLDRKFFGHARVAVHIPLTRGSRVAVGCLEDMWQMIPALLAEVQCIDSERTKLLLIQTKLQRWNHAFKRRMSETPPGEADKG